MTLKELCDKYDGMMKDVPVKVLREWMEKNEPLAVLADRKGKWAQIMRRHNTWDIDIFPCDEDGEVNTETPDFYVGKKDYSEAAARAYLEKLEDK